MRSRSASCLCIAIYLTGCQTAHSAKPVQDPPKPSASPTLRDAATQPANLAASDVPVAYTCSHHPKFMDAEPGDCPFCGAKLVPTNSRQMSPLRAAPKSAE